MTRAGAATAAALLVGRHKRLPFNGRAQAIIGRLTNQSLERPIADAAAVDCSALRQRRRDSSVRRLGMTGQMRIPGLTIARILAWAWALVAGIGGLALLIDEGPLPVTNGWFAMFSGIAACPLTGRLLKRHAGVIVPGYVQFAAALLILVAGRVAVVVLLHRPFLPECTGSCW